MVYISNSPALPQRRAIFFAFFVVWVLVLSACTHVEFKPQTNTPVVAGVDAQPMRLCGERLGKQLDFVDEKVFDALNASAWVGGYDLNRRYFIALQSSRVLRLYIKMGDGSQWTQARINDLFRLLSLKKGALTCVEISKFTKASTLRIISFEAQASNWEPISFRFISSLSSSEKNEDRWVKLASAFGKILLLQEDDFNSNVIEEVQRSIIHEGMHLYGQQKLFSQEPQGLEGTLKGRIYLRYLENTKEEYRYSIKREVCLDLDLMRLVVENNENHKTQVVDLLRKIFMIYSERDELFQVGTLDAYWYMVEGVPQFLDQKFILYKNPQKVLKAYDHYCGSPNGPGEAFYGNLAGAAILHGLDYLYHDSVDWKSSLKIDRDNASHWMLEIHRLIQENESVIPVAY